MPYGLAAQGTVLDSLAAYLLEQGLTAIEVDMRSLFAPAPATCNRWSPPGWPGQRRQRPGVTPPLSRAEG